MFYDADVRDRYVSVIEGAHCVASADLIEDFAGRVGLAIAQAFNRVGLPKTIAFQICDDEKLGEEIGAALLAAFKVGVVVGIEMEKPEVSGGLRMSFRDVIRSKPPVVSQMIHCLMTRASLDLPGEPDEAKFERLACDALTSWDEIYAEACALAPEPVTEEQLAELMIARLRKQEVWGKILRGNSN